MKSGSYRTVRRSEPDLEYEAREILDAARGADDPTPADRERIRRALAATLAAAAASGASTAAASSAAAASSGVASSAAGITSGSSVAAAVTSTTSASAGAATSAATLGGAVAGAGALEAAGVVSLGAVGAKALAGVAALGIVVGTTFAVAGDPSPVPSSSAVLAEPARETPPALPARPPSLVEPVVVDEVVAAPTDEVVAAPMEEPGAAVVESPVDEPRPARRRVRRPRVREPAARELAPTPDTLREELALLERANRALRNGDHAGVRLALGEHRARFPQGSLSIERRGLEALLACELNERGSAESFVAAHGRAPVARRVARCLAR